MLPSATTPLLRLSLCMATLNRAAWIGQTLDAFLADLPAGVEIVVVDGASSDGTEAMLTAYAAKHPALRYHREASNSGVDRDFDKAVHYACGEYIWLVSDDDVPVPGAVAQVLQRLQDAPDLLVVNAEIRDRELTTVLKPRQMPLLQDATYRSTDGAAGQDAFFSAAAGYLSFIGGVVMRREVWLARAREPYYGSLFIHVGVIFQPPALAHVTLMAAPLVRIRLGNAMWTARGFEIWTSKWPGLVWSFSHFSAAARQAVSLAQPGLRLTTMVWYRGLGAFTPDALRKARERQQPLHPLAGLLARVPASLLNLLLALVCAVSRHGDARMKLYELSVAGCALAPVRWLARRALSAPQSPPG